MEPRERSKHASLSLTSKFYQLANETEGWKIFNFKNNITQSSKETSTSVLYRTMVEMSRVTTKDLFDVVHSNWISWDSFLDKYKMINQTNDTNRFIQLVYHDVPKVFSGRQILANENCAITTSDGLHDYTIVLKPMVSLPSN